MSIRDDLALIDVATARIRAQLPSEGTIVRAGDNLHAALDLGGVVQLEPGATFEGQGFTISRPGTRILGGDATLRATTGPALFVLPGVHDVAVVDLSCVSAFQNAVQIGRNDSGQTTLDAVPRRTVLTNVTVTGHRNKRAFEINGADFALIDCQARDCWATGVETKGINILNSPGPGEIRGGIYEVGSIGILTGGDTMKIPGVIPTGIRIVGARVERPLSWRTDGISRNVKTGIEFKAGRDCEVRDTLIDGCWRDGQDGYGATVTPRSGASTVDILWQNVTMRNVSGGYNVTGHDTATVTPEPTTGLRVIGGSVVTNKALLGGRGTFLQLSSGPFGTIDLDDVVILAEHSIVYHGETSRIGRFSMTGCHALAGTYGLMFGNAAHAGNLSTLGQVMVTDNTFGDASLLARVLPANTYLTREALLALPAVQGRTR